MVHHGISSMRLIMEGLPFLFLRKQYVVKIKDIIYKVQMNFSE